MEKDLPFPGRLERRTALNADVLWAGDSPGVEVREGYGGTSPPSCLSSPLLLPWRSGTSRTQAFALGAVCFGEWVNKEVISQ